MQLTNGTLLQGGKYKIERVLGQGGFGITYLAEQVMLGRKVAVKEFFMKELCERNDATSFVTLGTESGRDTVNRFRDKFLKEARNIARLNHPHIVRIIDVFEENGTAYYVMEYAENGSLADKVKKEGYLSEPVATQYILQVADALDYVHQRKMNHLDVKPANIMLNEKDEVVLIDFGLSKQYDAVTGNQTSTTPIGISEGYAPMEQYMQGGVGAFSPQTDIYSLGATFYKLLTGVTPPNASLVNNEGLPIDELRVKGVSQKTIHAICQAMEGRKKDRTKDVAAFIVGLNTSTSSSQETVTAEDDEATVFTQEMQLTDEERKRKGTATKGTKKIAKSEAYLKNQSVSEVHDNAELRRKKEKKKSQQESHNFNSRKLWIATVIIAVVAVISGFYFISVDTFKNNIINEVPENEYFSNGILNVNGVTYDMAEVKGGTFTMGQTEEMKDPSIEENIPVWQVTITKDYYLGKTEVTQALWEAVMHTKYEDITKQLKWQTYGAGADYPMYNVSYKDCIKFIEQLNKLTGKEFRLPTEAEWEFAARGGNISKHYKYSGSNNIDDVAWCFSNSGNMIHPVATKQPNELGLYDMSGNISEWCSNFEGEYPTKPQIDPKGPSTGSNHIYKGGDFGVDAEFTKPCYSAIQEPNAPWCIGFRLALTK